MFQQQFICVGCECFPHPRPDASPESRPAWGLPVDNQKIVIIRERIVSTYGKHNWNRNQSASSMSSSHKPV